MIYAIVAIDAKKGLATDAGIPWDLPTDRAHFREKTSNAPILMGYRMYEELDEPLPDRRNLVLVRPGTELRPGFEPVEDVAAYLAPYIKGSETLWVVGGAKVYAQLLEYIQQLYITRVQADFACTKFFPAFEDQFTLVEKGPPQTENNLVFWYEVWRKN